MNPLLTEARVVIAEQGSAEWEMVRCGRFTASEMWKLMECGKRPMTQQELDARPKKGKGSATKFVPDPSTMGDKGWTYIYQKVAETLTGQPKRESYAFPLVWGKDTEPVAVEFFEKKFGVECEPAGFQSFTDHAGGSPDRFIGNDEGLEIKCPEDSTNQINYMMLTDRFDLKRDYPAHYWQCVSLLLFTGRKKWHFCTFDPRMIDDKHKMTHMEILASDVDEDMDAVVKAIESATKEKLKLLQTLSA